MDEREIRQLFGTHNVPLDTKDVWAVQGTPVIKHSALERLAAEVGISFDLPTVLRAERDEAVFLVRGTRKDGISEWSTGEALVVKEGQPGGNYKVSGKQAGYVFAMAEKRAKDRVIIKLAGLHGAYSEDEADEFKASNGDALPVHQPKAAAVMFSSSAKPSPDPLFESAKAYAQQGTAPLMAHLRSLSREHKDAIKPRLNELEKIADQADAMEPAQ